MPAVQPSLLSPPDGIHPDKMISVILDLLRRTGLATRTAEGELGVAVDFLPSLNFMPEVLNKNPAHPLHPFSSITLLYFSYPGG